jgi:hypothetical protein
MEPDHKTCHDIMRRIVDKYLPDDEPHYIPGNKYTAGANFKHWFDSIATHLPAVTEEPPK